MGTQEMGIGTGTSVRWMHCRGPGKVTFAKESVPRTRAFPMTLATTATFSAAGTYVLRVVADDGNTESVHDVTVNPAMSSQNKQ